jgi:hypothetical protein
MLLVCTVIVSLKTVNGLPSTSFTEQNGEWYDSWNINRNYYGGAHGYMPNIAYETLDSNKEIAYSIGQLFQNNYASKTDMVEAILNYVQTWTEYGYDSYNINRNDIPQEECAWNADEMAHAFNETTGITATGDCEDLAFLCATIYKGAGIDVAMVDAPEHVALLIWLPEYPNANDYWDIPDDNRGSGWIWVEATGESNPLGWTPPDFDDGDWNAYPLGTIEPIIEESKPLPIDLIITAVIAVAALMALIISAQSRKAVSNPRAPPPRF